MNFIRSGAIGIVMLAGIGASANAMPFDAQLSTRALSVPTEKASLLCTWVCLEHKNTAYGPVCVKRSQNCSMTPGLRHMPPPARTTPRR